MSEPSDAPPSYEEAAGSSRPNQQGSAQAQDQSHLKVRNGISPLVRRSMEDEGRALPEGWVRSYDPENDHQFFVDTKADPPRSIWHHPYDDEQYLDTLDPKERQRIKGLHRTPTDRDMQVESSDDDDAMHQQKGSSSKPGPSTSSAPTAESKVDKPKFGRRLKDKITQSTHEEREAARRQRAQEEAQYYERHRQLRQAMVEAARTGQPQFIGKDPRTGQDVYIEPPNGPRPPPGAYGYNPYAQGPYANPNAKFVRPVDPYSRPYGRGYGGGYGLPIAGGLLGGLLLGSALGGF